jgi:hypothetical protein
MATREQTVDPLGRVPAVAWALLVAVLILGTWQTTLRRMRRAGQRTANRDLVAGRARAGTPR